MQGAIIHSFIFDSEYMKDLTLIVVFLTLLIIPGSIGLIGNEDIDSVSENRSLKQRPVLSIGNCSADQGIVFRVKESWGAVMNYKDEYDNYYSDNFYLKSILFKAYYFIKTDVFGVDAIPEKVVRGKNGWLFLGESHSQIISKSKGFSNFPAHTLEVLHNNLESEDEWLNRNNIEYYIAVAPNKLSIYSNQLPIVSTSNQQTFQQFKSICEKLRISCIDMSAGMDTNSNRLFHKTNTHWNELGAFIGYKNLIKEIRLAHPDVPLLEEKDFILSNEVSYEEDLSKMLDTKIEEVRLLMRLKNKTASMVKSRLLVPQNFTRIPSDYEMRYQSSANSLKVLVFRDSFCTTLKDKIAESFGETVLIWSHKFDKQLILDEQPDIVIREIVERSLNVLTEEQVN